MLERWGTQLRPQGFLLVEEVEWIRTEHPLLRQYLEIQAALIRQQANVLYIGPRLEHHQVSEGLRRRLSRVCQVPVSTAQAATMFSTETAALSFVLPRSSVEMLFLFENDLRIPVFFQNQIC